MGLSACGDRAVVKTLGLLFQTQRRQMWSVVVSVAPWSAVVSVPRWSVLVSFASCRFHFCGLRWCTVGLMCSLSMSAEWKRLNPKREGPGLFIEGEDDSGSSSDRFVLKRVDSGLVTPCLLQSAWGSASPAGAAPAVTAPASTAPSKGGNTCARRQNVRTTLERAFKQQVGALDYYLNELHDRMNAQQLGSNSTTIADIMKVDFVDA